MEIDDLHREAIRCRNLGNKDVGSDWAIWYRDRGIMLTQAIDDLTAGTAVASDACERT